MIDNRGIPRKEQGHSLMPEAKHFYLLQTASIQMSYHNCADNTPNNYHFFGCLAGAAVGATAVFPNVT